VDVVEEQDDSPVAPAPQAWRWDAVRVAPAAEPACSPAEVEADFRAGPVAIQDGSSAAAQVEPLGDSAEVRALPQVCFPELAGPPVCSLGRGGLQDESLALASGGFPDGSAQVQAELQVCSPGLGGLQDESLALVSDGFPDGSAQVQAEPQVCSPELALLRDEPVPGRHVLPADSLAERAALQEQVRFRGAGLGGSRLLESAPRAPGSGPEPAWEPEPGDQWPGGEAQ